MRQAIKAGIKADSLKKVQQEEFVCFDLKWKFSTFLLHENLATAQHLQCVQLERVQSETS